MHIIFDKDWKGFASASRPVVLPVRLDGPGRIIPYDQQSTPPLHYITNVSKLGNSRTSLASKVRLLKEFFLSVAEMHPSIERGNQNQPDLIQSDLQNV